MASDEQHLVFVEHPATPGKYVCVALPSDWVEALQEHADGYMSEWLAEAAKRKLREDGGSDKSDPDLFKEGIRDALYREGVI